MEQTQKKTKKKSKETGRWTKEEHSKFILGLVNYGKNWKKVEELVGTRTGAQVRSHAQKFFNRLSKVKQNFKDHLDISQQCILNASESLNQVNDGQTNPLQQKATNPQKSSQDNTFSESGSDHQNLDKVASPQKHPEVSPRLVEIIKKQSENGKKPIQYKKFIGLLEQQRDKVESSIQEKKSSHFETEIQPQTSVQNAILEMQRQRVQLKNFTHLLIAYIALHGESLIQEDESFFLKLIKTQRQYIRSNHFFDLVDLPHISPTKVDSSESKPRKKSFTLVQQSAEFNQQLCNLKKKVKTSTTNEDNIPIINKEQSKQQQKDEEKNEQLPHQQDINAV